MSTSRRATKKKDDIFNKKIHENPKYKHIKHTVDTGSSITKYTEKVNEMRKNYKYSKDEIFKRIKVNTFAQLVLQVADVISMERDRDDLSTAPDDVSEGCATPSYEERRNTISDDDVPPLNLPKEEADRAKLSTSRTDTARTTLQDVICGVGEVDLREQDHVGDDSYLLSSRSSQAPVSAPDPESLPYLLLDVRTPDEFQQCHIIGALNYPATKLSEYNWRSKEFFSFEGKAGKIIILYDEDERTAIATATIIAQRINQQDDNVFMLSGGMNVLHKRFPGGFFTGSLPTSCLPSPPPTRKATKKPAAPPTFLTREGKHFEFFTSHHLQQIQDCLNEELLKQENSSRMSSRVSSRSSVASNTSRLSTSSSVRSKPAWK